MVHVKCRAGAPMDSTQNPAEAERLPLSKSHSTPATSGLRVSENPSPPKPKIVRAPSVLQVAAGRLLSTPTDEQRNADFYRRIRHVQRSGGVNIDRLKKKLSTGPASTPDVEMAETPSGIEMSTRLFRGVQRSLSTDSRKANSTRWPSDAHLRSRPNAIRVVAGDVYKKATGFRLNSIRKYETEISFEASSPQPEDDKTSLDVARSLPITLPGTSARSDLETIEEDELADREAQEDQAARTAASPVKSQSMDPHMSSAERRKNFKEQRKLRGVATEHISTADEPVAEIPLIRPSTLDLRPDAEFKRAVHLEDLFKRSTPSDPVIIIDKGGDLDEALTERSSPEVVVPDINVTYFGDGGELFFDESKVSEEQLLSDIEEALDEDEDKENVGFREPDDMQLTLRRRFPVDISGGAVPTIQVCDEHGAIESDRRGAEESVDFVFSRRTDATVRRKISMKRQDGVDEERKQDRQPFKGFFQRRLTQRLVKKESEDLREAEEAPIPYVQPFAPSVTMRTQRVAFHKEEEIRIEQEPSTRQRIPMGGFQGVKIRGAKFHGPEPPSVEPPAIRKQSRSSIFRRKMKTMKQAVTSAVKSLLGVKDLDQSS
uniref:Rhomboid domain-containing protein n=1 Tax=Steinernema glaseri TaxID=37863 RepID=A0A1I8AFY6_9BILA